MKSGNYEVICDNIFIETQFHKKKIHHVNDLYRVEQLNLLKFKLWKFLFLARNNPNEVLFTSITPFSLISPPYPMLNKFGCFNQPNRIGSIFKMGGVTPLKLGNSSFWPQNNSSPFDLSPLPQVQKVRTL